MKCNNCGKQIEVCPHCGGQLKIRKMKAAWIGTLSIILAFILFRLAATGILFGGVIVGSVLAAPPPTQITHAQTSAFVPTHAQEPEPTQQPWCNSKDVETSFRYFDNLRVKFLAAGDAAARSRGLQLVDAIADIASLKQQLDAYPVPACLKIAKADLAFGIEDTISGFDAFRQTGNPDDAAPYFKSADAWFEKFNTECERASK